jgi:CRISPR/Cas system CSM-associated protein Csm3 (group 7 of RAMP superfamily)
MHRLTCNELRLDFTLTPVSPLSIQARDAQPPRFVRAVHPNAAEPSAYIPGSTLKGALRAAAEQVLRSASIDCCDPTHPCSERDMVNQARDGVGIYRALCAACRIFGSKAMRSHLSVSDCFPADPVAALPLRDPAYKDDPLEVVHGEMFYGTLTLRNFERWQVGLLGLLLSRINIADIQLGGNRSAGMGCVALRYCCLSIVYPGLILDQRQQEALHTSLHGVGQLMGANNPYGFVYPDVADMADLPQSAALETGFGYVAVVIEEQKTADVSRETGPADSIEADESEPGDELSAPEIPESHETESIHDMIDNVLTQQALAWASYARAHKRR